VYIGQTYECINDQCTKYIISGIQIIAQISAAGTYYYHSDHLGSSSIITAGNGVAGKQAGDQIEDIFYYPYGETQTNAGSVNVKYKYTGKELDSDDGLYYYGARYYDPKLARFISTDTIVPRPFYPQSFNRYSYTMNNPIMLRDLDGHSEYSYNSEYYDTYCSGCSWGSSATNSNYNFSSNGNSGFTFSNNTGTWTDVGFNSGGSSLLSNSGYFSFSPVSADSKNGSVTYYYDGYSEIWSGGSRSWRNNNPGNLVYGDFARENRSLGVAGGFAIFPDYQTGYGALSNWLQSPIRSDWTLTETMHSFAPSKENNTAAYIRFITDSTGIDTNTTLGALNSLQVNDLANTIQRYEGYVPGTITPFYDMRRR
jgi:RHS repeat-associated protein